MSHESDSPSRRPSRTERARGDIDAFWSSPWGTAVGASAVIVAVGGIVLSVLGVF